MPKEYAMNDGTVLTADCYQRLLVDILEKSETPLRTIELARRVGGRVDEYSTTGDLRSIYHSLYYTHLPRLVEAGVVVYDETEWVVRPGRKFDDALRLLE